MYISLLRKLLLGAECEYLALQQYFVVVNLYSRNDSTFISKLAKIKPLSVEFCRGLDKSPYFSFLGDLTATMYC